MEVLSQWQAGFRRPAPKQGPWVLILQLTLLATLFAIILPGQAAIADESLEKRVKAAFLHKFGGYVEWPPTAFATQDSPLILCLLGSDADFNAALEKMAQGTNIHGHPLAVRELHAAEAEADCHILYVGTSDTQTSAEALEAARGKHVLTVSDSAAPGIISFVIANNRVRFNIDDKAAAENGLVISSKLLDLAANVTRRNQEAQN